MRVTISPSKAVGDLKAPPSKSMAHRMLICAGLSDGISIVKGVEPSEDVLATIDCLNAMGAECTLEGSTVTVKGIHPADRKENVILPCRECGSTLRFFVPLCLMKDAKASLTGSERLMNRPLSIYEELCKEKGFVYQKEGNSLCVQGVLTGGEYHIPGNVSSQFISGLLFALPLCEEDSRIDLIPPVESRPYIDMTIEALSLFGVTACWENDHCIMIPGSQRYQKRETEVEGDWSNAAFFEAFNYLDGNVGLSGLKDDSLQGDKICREHLKKLSEGMQEIDISDCPDLGPILMAMASVLHGARLTGTRRLRIKESDRAEAMREELEKFGATVVVNENDVWIPKVELHCPKELLMSHNDHRIAMSLAVVSSRYGGVIDGAECVRKSLPDFFTRIGNLGVEVTIDGMDQ